MGNMMKNQNFLGYFQTDPWPFFHGWNRDPSSWGFLGSQAPKVVQNRIGTEDDPFLLLWGLVLFQREHDPLNLVNCLNATAMSWPLLLGEHSNVPRRYSWNRLRRTLGCSPGEGSPIFHWICWRFVRLFCHWIMNLNQVDWWLSVWQVLVVGTGFYSSECFW